MSTLLDYDDLCQRYGLSRRYVRDTLTGKPEKPRLQAGEDVKQRIRLLARICEDVRGVLQHLPRLHQCIQI